MYYFEGNKGYLRMACVDCDKKICLGAGVKSINGKDLHYTGFGCTQEECDNPLVNRK